MKNKQERQIFPHATPKGVLKPIREFAINGRYLGLYAHMNRPACSCYSLYWEDEQNSVQHNMTYVEVFNVLSDILEKNNSNKSQNKLREYVHLRQALRMILRNLGLWSSASVTDYQLVDRIKGLLSKNKGLKRKNLKKRLKAVFIIKLCLQPKV